MTFKVHILGSNSAIPTLKRNPTSQVVNHNEQLYLLDCAEGTQLQLRRYKIRIQRINNIFISHLHGDHFFGLIGLISTMHLLGRKKELHVYAPAPLKDIIDLQLKVSKTELCYPFHFHAIATSEEHIIFENEKLTISTIPLDHSVPTCGFLFREKQGKRRLNRDKIEELNISVNHFKNIKNGDDFVDDFGKTHVNKEITFPPYLPRTYAYCSDTRYLEPVANLVQDADLLYHEATFLKNFEEVAYNKFHSTAQQAGKLAKLAGAKKLLIGHFSNRYDKPEELVDEAKTEFENTEAALDGNVFEITSVLADS